MRTLWGGDYPLGGLRFLHCAMDVARRRIPNGHRPGGGAGPELGPVSDTEYHIAVSLRTRTSYPIFGAGANCSAAILSSSGAPLRPIG